MVRKASLTAVAMLAFLLPNPGGATGEKIRVITQDTLLAGGTTITGEEVWKAGPGVTITVESPLTIHGKLLLEGSGDKPVRLLFQNETGYGLVVKGGSIAGKNIVIEGSGNGMEIYGGMVELTGGRITVAGIQINSLGMSELNISKLLFEGGKAGVIFRTGAGGTIRECRFANQKRAGIYVYGTENVTIQRSLFVKSGSGVTLSLYGANAAVEDSRFEGNSEGVRVEKLAFSRISDSYFTENGYGMVFTKRSRGVVTGNVFDDNDVSVYVRYSSYPTFRKNLFKGYRRYAVMLENQSSEWEATAAGTAREGQFGHVSGSPPENFGRALPDPGKLELPGKVLTGKLDFRGNFWGDLSDEISEKGPGGNITGIFDGRDMPEFEDRGKKYPLDTVDFSGHLVRVPEEGKR